ncbi:MAG: S9 family peptidase, partial [Thermaurantiacus sp.]
MRPARFVAVAVLGVAATVQAQTTPDLATRFGQRAAVLQISMSPDGRHVAVIAAARGRSTVLLLVEANEGAKTRVLTGADGNPDTLRRCNWASTTRIVCTVSAIVSRQSELWPVSRVFSVDTESGAITALSTRQGFDALGVQLHG